MARPRAVVSADFGQTAPPVEPRTRQVEQNLQSALWLRIFRADKRLRNMNTTDPIARPSYATGYAKGRHAAKEFIPTTENPYRRGSQAYHGWNDGHYDERSARHLAVARHSAALWTDR